MSAHPATRQSPDVAAPSKPSTFRPDVQGLRAIAVVAVILDHLARWPSGGFIGVDVFFVISGFLITGLLLREYEKTGSISFADFYRRRVRRIMPAALLVLAVTSVATWAIFSAVRAQGVLADAFWAAVFAANWRFVVTGTDYSQADGIVSPVQHYWSLSVEEQFYFVWPLLMLAVFVVARGRRRDRVGSGPSVRSALAVVLGVLVVASFCWALWETASAPTWAYFSTFSRGWELGVGALLAVLAPTLARIPRAARAVLSWLGIAGIAVSLGAISEASAFPAPWAALPVLSASLVIAAGVGGVPRSAVILTNPVSRYLGDVSYSLYLWHWPVIVLLPAFFDEQDPLFYVVAVGVIVAASLLSYHLVEDPIRRSRRLDPSAPPPAAGTGRGPIRRLTDRYGMRDVRGMTITVGAVLLAGLLVLVLTPVLFPQRMPPASQAPGGTSEAAPGSDDPVAAQSSLISTALRATSFPELVPPLDQLDTSVWFSEVASPDCLNIATDEQSIACESGPTDTGKDVVILGDSFGIAWTPGIRAALEPLGYRVHPLTRGECPASDTRVTRAGGQPFPACDDAHRWRPQRIAAIAPDLTIIVQAHTTVGRLASGAEGADGARELASGLRSTVDGIAPTAGRILVLSPPPLGTSMQECVTNVGSPADCVAQTDALWYQVTEAEQAALEGSGATYALTQDWFCEDDRCPGFVGNTAVRVDTAHLSIEYSEMLAPSIAATVADVMG